MSMKTMELPGMSEAAAKQVEMLGCIRHELRVESRRPNHSPQRVDVLSNVFVLYFFVAQEPHSTDSLIFSLDGLGSLLSLKIVG